MRRDRVDRVAARRHATAAPAGLAVHARVAEFPARTLGTGNVTRLERSAAMPSCRVIRAAASSLATVLLVLVASNAAADQSPQLLLDGRKVPRFVDPLPALEVLRAGDAPIELRMTEFPAQVLPTGMPPTWVWGYLQPGQASRPSYIGPVIVATRGRPTEIKFVNDLGTAAATRIPAVRFATDQTIHWADPLNGGANECAHMVMPPATASACAQNYLGPIPTVVHLHGGAVPPQLDGGPDAWTTSDGGAHGPAFYSRDGATAGNHMIYRYPNTQESAPLWFHDHALGLTRVNVYAGLAGIYLIEDPPNDPRDLPPLVPLMIQDRLFDTNGQLFFQADDAGGTLWAPNPDHPYWGPELIGDVIVVNGKAWPYLEVERRRITLLLVNGSNARTYELSLPGNVDIGASGGSSSLPPAPMWVIGTGGGYLDEPRPVSKLVLMPGERYRVVVDFSRAPAGAHFVLRNGAKAPFPGGSASLGASTADVMEFRVVGGKVADASFDPSVPGARLRGGAGQGPALVRLVDPASGKLAPGVRPQRTRQLTLNEVEMGAQATVDPVTGVWTQYPGGPLEVLLNNTHWSGERAVGVTAAGAYGRAPIPGFVAGVDGKAFASERPAEGETEVWEIVNLTEDAHPIHLHLTQFQVMNRQRFDKRAYGAAYAAAFPGGGIDPMTLAPYPPGTYIPGFGPPLDYATGNARALGGNPDIAALAPNGKPAFLVGAPEPPLPHEAGWKDTVVTYPGTVTRLAVRWAPTDVALDAPPALRAFPFDPGSGGFGYVWHCHILDHEDNEMMRPTLVQPIAGVPRSYLQGVDY
jgi:FtsP/CotA-like multicopper oxidase with cupredoxin domain